MKRLSTIIIASLLLPATLMAGGIVTNTNQSASFIRMPSRDASLNLDAAYYNPAGLSLLKDGFYLSFSNQTVLQTRTIGSTFTMNRQEFEGKVMAPLFPSVYAIYKKDKVAYSLGIVPIGGGGTAGFETGLPSFEQQVAVLPAMLSAPVALGGANIPTTQYGVNAKFDGSSLNWGFQFNAAYALSDMFSLSLGARIVTANNSYSGYLKDVMINPTYTGFNQGGRVYAGTMVSAPQFFADGATTLNGLAAGATATSNGLTGLITAGTITAATLVSDLDAATIGAITTILGAANISATGMNVGTAIGTLNAVAPNFTAGATRMTGFSRMTSNAEIDAEQTGMGITPVIGVNIKVMENLNVALKYEHLTQITMTNDTDKDDVGMFPDGAKTPNDMPGMISAGVAYKPISKLNVTAGYHLYLDKGANYGKKMITPPATVAAFVDNDVVIDKDFWEAAFGVEYEVTDKILVSAGFLRTQTGVNADYQSDLSHSLSTNSIGLGGRYMVMENLGVNVGFMKTMYESYTKIFTGYEETYKRDAMVFAIGLDYNF
jgi:long-subunit fatty acid transport protein